MDLEICRTRYRTNNWYRFRVRSWYISVCIYCFQLISRRWSVATLLSYRHRLAAWRRIHNLSRRHHPHRRRSILRQQPLNNNSMLWIPPLRHPTLHATVSGKRLRRCRQPPTTIAQRRPRYLADIASRLLRSRLCPFQWCTAVMRQIMDWRQRPIHNTIIIVIIIICSLILCMLSRLIRTVGRTAVQMRITPTTMKGRREDCGNFVSFYCL